MLKFFIATLACALILNDVSGQFVPITRTSGSQTQFTPEQIQQLQQLQQLMAQQQQQQKPVVQQQTQQFVQQPVVQQQTQQFVQTTTVRPTTGLEQQLLEQQMLTQRLQEQLKLIQQQQQQKLQQQQIQQQNLLQQLQTFEGRPQSNQVPVAAPVEPAQRVQFQSVQGIVNNTVRVPVQQVQQVQQVPVQQVQQVQQVPVQQVPVQQVQKFQQIPLTGAVPNFQQQQLQQQQLQLQQLQQLQKQQQQQQQQVTVQGVNDEICNNAQPGDLIAHPTDAAQFVICYGFGEFTVMDCPEMLVYNAHLKRCDVNTEAPLLCKSNPCVNGGKCVELSTAQFKCECASGFGGQFCEKLDTCSTRPCGNEGVCIPFVLGSPVAHVCLCNGGRSIGPSCQRTEPNPCLSVNSNSRLLPVGLNPSVFAHCEGSRPHFKFCQPPLVFSAARQECEWA